MSEKGFKYTSRSPFDVLIDLVQFINDNIKLLSYILCLHNSGIYFSFRTLEFLVQCIYWSLSFCDINLNFLFAWEVSYTNEVIVGP
jgi:hypothetical protein